MLGNDHDGSGGVARDMSREDGGVNNEQIVRPVDLGVGVNDSSATATTIIGTPSCWYLD